MKQFKEFKRRIEKLEPQPVEDFEGMCVWGSYEIEADFRKSQGLPFLSEKEYNHICATAQAQWNDDN